MRRREVLERVNLPDLTVQLRGWEAVHGLSRDKDSVIRDPRPGFEEHHPSFSLFRREGIWRWKRHGGDGASGTAFDLLLFFGYSEEGVWEELARRAGVSLDAWAPGRNRPTYQPPDPLQEAQAALRRCAPLKEDELRRAHGLLNSLDLQDAAGRDLQRRGLYGWEGIQAGRLCRDFRTRDGRTLAHVGALGVLIPGPDGQPWGLKVRNLGSKAALDASGLLRYVYRIAGHGAPAWCSPSYGQGDGVLIVEGELNGAAAARSLQEAGVSVDVQGLAGAGGTPFLHGLQGKPVYLYADPDEAGAACLERVGKVVRAAGAREVRVLAPLPSGDFSDLCGELGAAEFGADLLNRIAAAVYWQKEVTGKSGLPVDNAVQHEEKRLLANWQYISGWSSEDTSGWGSNTGGWGSTDRGGW